LIKKIGKLWEKTTLQLLTTYPGPPNLLEEEILHNIGNKGDNPESPLTGTQNREKTSKFYFSNVL
jgi:hypothetical protein